MPDNSNPIKRIISFRSFKPGQGRFMTSSRLKYWGLFLFTFISIAMILSWKYFPARNYQEGVVSSRDIMSPRSFDVINKQATREAQSEAMNEVQPVHRIDPFILNQLDRQLRTQFRLINEIKNLKDKDDHLQLKEIKSRLPIAISDPSLATFINSDPQSLEQMEILTGSLVMRHMSKPIRDNDVTAIKQVRQELRQAASELTLRQDQNKAVAELASEAIRPNSRVDWDETYRLKQAKKDSVPPVTIRIKKGQIIVSKGQIITPDHLMILEEMGLHRSRANTAGIAGTAILSFLIITLVWLYIKKSKPYLAQNPKHLLLLAIITVVNLILCSLLVQVNPYWAPVPIASILTAILLGPRIAVIITAVMAMIVGILTGEVQYLAVTLITGIAASLLSWRVRERLDLIIASLMIFIVNELSITLFSLLQGGNTRALLEDLVYGGINGFSSGIVAIGVLPILEYAFGITTDIKLLELSSQSEPLMKRLLLEAPGTYHHSIIVGNLAEAGGEAIGEDALLCRVAAYYHDIGKLRRPYFFIENQLGSENPHDKLTPRLSALIITAHIKDGLELAKRYKIPEPIRDIISQHHGTSTVAYFLHQARQLSPQGEEPREEDFRYAGPRPNSRVAAIVMLADSAEAAARTLNNPTPQAIETLVRSIFKKALDDGQLDQCPISLKDINNLINSFTTILTGIYHHRIEYPDQIIENGNAPTSFTASKITHINKKMG